ncbi:hypothetical protein [Thalassiella azotivora]
MDLVYQLLVVLHLVGMAMLVGGWLVTVRTPKVLPGMWHGALTQLVTGVALVGLASADVVDRDVDNAKITVKLLVALAVAVVVFLARRRKEGDAGMVHAVGGLSLLNVLIAVLWR